MLEDENYDFEADLFIECEILDEAEEIEEETVVTVPDWDPHISVYIPSVREVSIFRGLTDDVLFQTKIFTSPF